tara:strand:- start:75 stop:284 length:210 start_codon:yes stop_codon:yes gene_type:complete
VVSTLGGNEMSDADNVQNARIRDLENRVNQVENDLSAILAKLDTLTSLGKGLALLAGAALGVDILPMMQ